MQAQLRITCKVSIPSVKQKEGNFKLTNTKRALSTLTTIMAVAVRTTKFTYNYNTLPLHTKPISAVAARGTSKHTSDLTKICLLVCRLASVEVAARLQGRDSTCGGQGSEAAGSGSQV